jgi:hypothetical protein
LNQDKGSALPKEPYKAFFVGVDGFGRKRLRRGLEEALRRLDSEQATEGERELFEQIIYACYKALRLPKKEKRRRARGRKGQTK